MFLPTVLAHVANTSVSGLHYVLIYVSYNEILFLLYLLNLCNIHASAVKDFTWPN
jgi:hypothetical protein